MFTVGLTLHNGKGGGAAEEGGGIGARVRVGEVADGMGPPDPKPRNLANWCC